MSYNKDHSNKIAYIHGYLEAQIEAFAKSTNITASELTERLGALFLHTSIGELLGIEDNMPVLRNKTTKRNKTTRKMEMDGRTSHKSSYWSKMTPEQRSAEMKRRMALSRKRKKNKEKINANNTSKTT